MWCLGTSLRTRSPDEVLVGPGPCTSRPERACGAERVRGRPCARRASLLKREEKEPLKGRRESAAVFRDAPFTSAEERAYKKKREMRTSSSRWCSTLLREAVPLRSESA